MLLLEQRREGREQIVKHSPRCRVDLRSINGILKIQPSLFMITFTASKKGRICLKNECSGGLRERNNAA